MEQCLNCLRCSKPLGIEILAMPEVVPHGILCSECVELFKVLEAKMGMMLIVVQKQIEILGLKV